MFPGYIVAAVLYLLLLLLLLLLFTVKHEVEWPTTPYSDRGLQLGTFPSLTILTVWTTSEASAGSNISDLKCTVVQMLLSPYHAARIYMVSRVHGSVIGGAQETGGQHSTLPGQDAVQPLKQVSWKEKPPLSVSVISHNTPLWFGKGELIIITYALKNQLSTADSC